MYGSTNQSSLFSDEGDNKETDDAATPDGWVAEEDLSYSMELLRTWEVCFKLRGTIWQSDRLLLVLLQLMSVSLVSGVLAFFFIPNPALLDASKFSGITALLSLFVSLMLSFFLSSSVSRWLVCVGGFEDLFNAIRSYSNQLHALGAPRERTRMCLHYSLLSVYFLVHELRTGIMPNEDKGKEWRKLSAFLQSDDRGPLVKVVPEEMHFLEEAHDRPGHMWLMVNSLLGRMAADGEIPNAASATFSRLVGIAQSAQEGVRTVRNSVIVQTPWIYAHLLACLVHLNCFLLAVNLGLACGVVLHGMRMYMRHYYWDPDGDKGHDENVEPMTSLIQSLIVELSKGICAPLLYQAFFDIGISIASPFSSRQAHIPVNRFLKGMERDLMDNERFAENPVFWKSARFGDGKHS